MNTSLETFSDVNEEKLYQRWHDVLLDIWIAILEQFGSEYKNSFDCDSFYKTFYPTSRQPNPCDKCKAIKKKGAQSQVEEFSNKKEERDVIRKCAPINRENKDYIRKRRPVDFTMEDLVEEMEYLEEGADYKGSDDEDYESDED